MPALFPPISFLRTHTLEGPYFSEPKVSFNQASLFSSNNPWKVWKTIEDDPASFWKQRPIFIYVGHSVVSRVIQIRRHRRGLRLHFPSAFFWGNNFDLLWLRHKRCFFFHGNRTNWYTLHLARCKMHICKMAKQRKPPFFFCYFTSLTSNQNQAISLGTN